MCLKNPMEAVSGMWLFEYAIPIGSGTVKSFGLTGGGIASLEEMCPCGGRTLRFQTHTYFWAV